MKIDGREFFFGSTQVPPRNQEEKAEGLVIFDRESIETVRKLPSNPTIFLGFRGKEVSI